MTEQETLVSAAEARKQLGGICKMTECRWRHRGILPQPTRIGNRNFYKRSDIDRIISEGA